ncbi:MAG: insulinase family protein [Bacteroidales bacterium]|jgi:zinc protease|nr:insulinase family protein [Bacteroidales bacterium]
MRKIIVAVAFFWAAMIIPMGAQDLTAPINPDPNVRIGTLKNGMTYYLRANAKPEKRIEYRLAVRAGSMQENEDQLGLAHFTEHMAFNGIKGYPGNTLVSELQKVGVSFGADINAYTSFDQTVYMIQIPSDDQKYVKMGVDILFGWASALLYDPKEIDQERGVIIEEYRMGLGASDRMRKKWFPVVFNGSRYADRLPIGTLDILQNFKYQTIKDFYKDWYRPDLQAIVIVGDINVDEMEQTIIKRFSKIKPVKNPREKIMYPIPEHKEPRAVVCTDPEAMGNQFFFYRLLPHFTMKTQGDFRTYLVHSLYNSMIGARLSDLAHNPDCPFLQANIGYSSFIGNADCYGIEAACKENQIKESMIALKKEDYRVLKHGFLQTELNRAKEEMLNNLEIAAKEVDKTESGRFANEYVSNYIDNEPIPGAKREYAMAKKFMEGINLEEINALAKQWIPSNGYVAAVMAPEKEGVTVPTEQEIIQILKDKSLENVEPYVDTYKDIELVDKSTLQKGTIVEEKEIPEIKAKVVTLSNGIKVYLKKTDFKNDEIVFSAQSKGGMSLYPTTDISSASFAAGFVDEAGIGELDMPSLQKKMKGKRVGLTPHIGQLTEGLSGTSTPKDLEFFMQYLHAFFTTPRHDTSVYKLVTNQVVEQMKMIKANPQYKFFGAFMDEITQKDPYQTNMLTMTEDFVKSANYERAFNIYKERFSNAADFDFVFVGNYDEIEMARLLQDYVASLPTNGNKENYRDVTKGFPATKIEKEIFAGKEEQSWVGIAFNENYPWSLENNMILNHIREALQIELIATIREKMSGVYSPMLQLGYDKDPKSEYTMLVLFSCSPQNTDTLTGAVFNILNTFAKEGPSDETLVKVKEQMIRGFENDLQQNTYWQNYIMGKITRGENFNDINTFKDRVNAVTKTDIVNFIGKYFRFDHHVKMCLYPEAKKE